MYTIGKEYRFEAAHRLGGLPDGHQCGRWHGHSYTVQVAVASDRLAGEGWIMDFAALAPLGRYLDTEFDHRTLNDVLDQPTSELLAAYLYRWCVDHLALPAGARIAHVRVSETAKTWAEYTETAAVPA